MSIDIDFWNNREISELREVLDIVKNSNISVTVVDEHHDLIDDINNCEYSKIINIDAHSDICNVDCVSSGNVFEYEPVKLNCGSWANFVNTQNHFLWYYPIGCNMDLSLCHFPQDDDNNPFLHPELTRWKKLTMKEASMFPYEVFYDCCKIGIAMSYKWINLKKASSMMRSVKNILGVDLPYPVGLEWSEVYKTWRNVK